jgi:hypothetical protein
MMPKVETPKGQMSIYPGTWSVQGDEELAMVTLTPTDHGQEHAEIEQLFLASLQCPSAQVTLIQRVQNQHLWQFYLWYV